MSVLLQIPANNHPFPKRCIHSPNACFNRLHGSADAWVFSVSLNIYAPLEFEIELDALWCMALTCIWNRNGSNNHMVLCFCITQMYSQRDYICSSVSFLDWKSLNYWFFKPKHIIKPVISIFMFSVSLLTVASYQYRRNTRKMCRF